MWAARQSDVDEHFERKSPTPAAVMAWGAVATTATSANTPSAGAQGIVRFKPRTLRATMADVYPFMETAVPRPHANATRTARTSRIVLLPLVITAILVYTATPVVGQAVTLGHPTVEQRISQLGVDPADGYRFVMFGDQKGLWKRDFPAVLKRTSQLAADKAQPPLLFMVDTGDIVESGLKAKQFRQLKKILSPVADLPYLVAVGNHELKPKQSKSGGRRNTATFLAGVDPDFSPDRMYYAKTVGPVRFLFLNSNDFPAAYDPQPGVAARSRAQMDWLEEQLQTDTYMTIALMHHPFVQSCDKHQEQATRIWNYEYPDRGSRTFAEILIEGGVDLALKSR